MFGYAEIVSWTRSMYNIRRLLENKSSRSKGRIKTIYVRFNF